MVWCYCDLTFGFAVGALAACLLVGIVLCVMVGFTDWLYVIWWGDCVCVTEFGTVIVFCLLSG